MRWLLRRLVFYVFAVWVALTLNFLLPRLMPGDPIGGVLQRLSPAADPRDPVALVDEDVRDGITHVRIVVDDEDRPAR